ncbi:MAG: MurR/RpiR family transcriptional regulator [Succinivibrio sp.]|uniref:MurR/RpiR family transcriptional regulator n=1 Tax=Succinivibrio faecicola TaxID=2820300 RepID=A0ABS7DFT3_9GAMM|nr:MULTISPECIES: MurR/RpiR family transcriptional regulator [Succinivibrio]MBW7570138.1 MurR/RpiR family transcriptional regulator [Succinivibrio faecicola]MCI6938806.1 MurR/RpiR family transcriptional regulator [Succinatimonas hippei]MDD6205794.1 MurR/RpiR family transcriptional regulator [Succinivibrio sp.]
MANILDRIASETELTKSERKLASIILKNPAAVVNENIADLAKRACVSEPSVCRFCKRFGADGFPAFKLLLSSLVSSSDIKKVDGIKSGDSVSDVISKSIGKARSQLLNLERNIDESLISRVIDVISQSRRLIILALGLSEFIAKDIHSRMLQFGFVTEVYTDRMSQELAVATLHSSDVALVICSSGEHPDLINIVKSVKQNGAVSVVLTSDETKFKDDASLVVSVTDKISPDDESYFDNRVSLLLLSQIIVSGVSLRRALAVNANKDKLLSARKKIYNTSEKTDAVEEKVETNSKSETQSPITSIDWSPY